jgi:hypothetical protein
MLNLQVLPVTPEFVATEIEPEIEGPPGEVIPPPVKLDTEMSLETDIGIPVVAILDEPESWLILPETEIETALSVEMVLSSEISEDSVDNGMVVTEMSTLVRTTTLLDEELDISGFISGGSNVMVTLFSNMTVKVDPLLQTSAKVRVEFAYGKNSVVLNSIGSSGSWLTGMENTVTLSTDAVNRQSSGGGSTGA